MEKRQTPLEFVHEELQQIVKGDIFIGKRNRRKKKKLW